MAQWHKVWPGFWIDTRSWRDDERMAAIYLLTCSHRVTEGLFPLPAEYAAVDTGWALERYVDAEGGVAARGWVVRDAEWVCIVNALKFDGPKSASDNRTRGAANAVAGAPRSNLAYAAFYESAGKFSPGLRSLLEAPSRPLADSGAFSPSEAPSHSSAQAQAQLSSTTTAARDDEHHDWFVRCVRAGEAKGAAWARNLLQLAEYEERTAALFAQTDSSIVRSVRRDVLDSVTSGRIRNDFPKAVRSFVTSAEAVAEGRAKVGPLPTGLMAPTTGQQVGAARDAADRAAFEALREAEANR